MRWEFQVHMVLVYQVSMVLVYQGYTMVMVEN